MDDSNTQSKKSFWKKMIVIISAGIILILVVYVGKKYNTSQKKAAIAEFYNQFSDQNYIDFAKMIEKAIHEERPDDIDKNVYCFFFRFFKQRTHRKFQQA